MRVPATGLLAVDKTPGMTSHDVVHRVRRVFRTSAGHLGTLDPGASGLLLVALGAATRCAGVWQGGEKTYQATMRFGVVTSTQDLDGDVIETRAVALDEREIRAASEALVGDSDQVPPMVSALKVRGERLYAIARRGQEVERAARRIHVSEWTWLEISPPQATFRVRCSGGTYVRTLAHDLGQRLGTGAALAALRRLRSEPFGLERAVRLDALERGDAEALWRERGYSMEEALGVLPSITLEPEAATAIGYGSAVRVSAAAAAAAPRRVGRRSVVLRDRDGIVLALGELTGEAGAEAVVSPHVVFPWAVREGRS